MSFIGGLLGGLFGGVNKDAPKVNYTPPGFNAGGLSASFGGNAYSVTPSAGRTNLVGGLSSTFGQQASDIAGLRSQVTPGFSNLRAAQLASLQNQQTAGIGNLRDSLAQRRVLGSSFANDAINRANMEYEQQRQQVIAQTYLQEIDASNKLLQQQYEAARGQFQTGLNEMNLEASIASQLTDKASSTLQSAASTQAQLDMAAQANKAQFWAGIGSMAGSFLSGGLSLGGGGMSPLSLSPGNIGGTGGNLGGLY